MFFLSNNPNECAKFHVNKHIVSQLKESCQMLSTTHRILDGIPYIDTASGRKNKRWKLNTLDDSKIYKATHINHPMMLWVRQSSENYKWLCKLLSEICVEYRYRYERIHKCESDGLVELLCNNMPNNIPKKIFTEPPLCMPDECKIGDPVESYREYYRKHKNHIFSWKNRQTPFWVNS